MGRSVLWGNNGMGAAAPPESTAAEVNRDANETGDPPTTETPTEPESIPPPAPAPSNENETSDPPTTETRTETESTTPPNPAPSNEDQQASSSEDESNLVVTLTDSEQETKPPPQKQKNLMEVFVGQTEHIDAKAYLRDQNGNLTKPSKEGERLAPYWSNSPARSAGSQSSGDQLGVDFDIMPLPTPTRGVLSASIPGAVAMVGQPNDSMPPQTNVRPHEQDIPDVEHTIVASSRNLVEATALASREFRLQEAMEVGELELFAATEEKKDGKRNLLGWGALALLILAGALGLGFGLARNKSDASATLEAPTMAPSEVPSSAPTGALDMLLDDLPYYSLEGLKVFGSPQWMAWDWLAAHPNITTYSHRRRKQLFALVTFYYSYGGPSWNEVVRSRWLQYDVEECFWFQTTSGDFDWNGQWYQKDFGSGPNPCNENGDFFQLRLNKIGLLPASASIPSEIEIFSSLEALGLRDAQISGRLSDWLPSQIYHLPHLSVLDLDENQFTGTLPSQLGLLSKLGGLSIASNFLSGSIPSELAKLTFGNLRLEKNLMTGTLPQGLDFTNMHRFRLQSNHFTGTLPTEVGLSTKLHFFSIWGNELTGSIPTQFGLATTLVYLGLWQNQLTGTLPSELFSLTMMDRCFLNENALSGTIPTEFGTLTALRRTVLHANLFSGAIPSELGLMGNATEFFAQDNRLTGRIPSQLGLMPSDKLQLTFSDNVLTGSLPSQLGQLSGLKRLFLDNTNLSGRIPTQFGNLSSMEALSLRQTGLEGSIPTQLGRMTRIQGLYLGDTLLSGEIPSEIGLLNQSGILELSNMTGLTGSIPLELSNLDLQVLKLGGSVGLSGSVPEEICHIGDLNCTLSRSDYWWLMYRTDTPKCELQFDCTSQLCGCGCPCPSTTNETALLNGTP